MTDEHQPEIRDAEDDTPDTAYCPSCGNPVYACACDDQDEDDDR